MSGPTKRYTGGNVNFLIEKKYRVALDEVAERNNVLRSNVMREIVKNWYEAEGFDLDEDGNPREAVA